MPGRVLLRGQWRVRRARLLGLAAALALAFLGAFGVGMVLDGASAAVERPLRDMLTFDARVTNGTDDLAGGRAWEDARPLASDLRRTGAQVSFRYELAHVTVRADAFENWSAGLLVGLDPADPQEVRHMAGYLSWGAFLDRTPFDPDTGVAYVPLLVGSESARRLNLTLDPSGGPDFSQVLTVTSGRLTGSSSAPRPVTVDAVVVGVFDTGLEPLDRFTAFLPIAAARELAGGHAGDPSANALLTTSGDPASVQALDPDLRVESAHRFAQGYLGPLAAVLDVAAGAVAALVLGVLAVWLVHETASGVRAEAQAIAALRAVGVPPGPILLGYCGPAVAVVGAAWLAAAVLAALAAWLSPGLPVSGQGFSLAVPLVLRASTVLAAGAAALLLAAAAVAVAGWRLFRMDLLRGLRAP